jgi:hypothetical protein
MGIGESTATDGKTMLEESEFKVPCVSTLDLLIPFIALCRGFSLAGSS